MIKLHFGIYLNTECKCLNFFFGFGLHCFLVLVSMQSLRAVPFNFEALFMSTKSKRTKCHLKVM